jgi:hypothetical protein
MAEQAMPLQDHFHPPLALQRHWHSFHNSWATYLASALNAQLPANFFAEANVHFGIEIDVATDSCIMPKEGKHKEDRKW